MRFLLFSLLFLDSLFSYAQLRGRITSEDGEPLPFASIYVKGSTIGTTSNAEGDYLLRLQPGSYEVIFQYVGYKPESRQVVVSDQELILDVTLQKESLLLESVEVVASAEDPAYEVIRAAIARRKYYRDLIDAYSCRSYIKGKFELLESPDKFMGEEIGDMDGWLDSTGTGIVYLSESESYFYKRNPGDVKEVMISSRVSGFDGGFSFNTALALDFSLYEDAVDLGPRALVSPIAGNALAHYEYELLGTFYDEDGRLVNKIRVEPKRSTDPVFEGNIYIYEDFWSIHSTDLVATGRNFQNPILDTLRLQLLNVHIEKDIWVALNKTLQIRFRLFGFAIGGGFTGVFSNYDLQPQFEKGFFGNEMFRVEKEANDKSRTYWDSIRPVPLSELELEDYRKKDSLVKVWDTIQPESGSSFDLLGGYSHTFKNRRSSLSVGSPLFNAGFTAVEGLTLALPAKFRVRDKGSENTANRGVTELYTRVKYGFAEDRLRIHGGINRESNNYRNSSWSLEGGVYLSDLNDREAMTHFANSFYSTILKENLTHFFEERSIRASWSSEVSNGLWLDVSARYSDRSTVNNNSDYSLFSRDEEYEPNTFPFVEPLYNNFSVRTVIRYKPGMKYFSYPDRKVNVGSAWPWIKLTYEKGIPAGDANSDYDLLELAVNDRMNFGVYGELGWIISAGMFLNNNTLSYVDYKHFDGNETIFQLPGDYLKSFQALPYYSWSASDKFLEAHLSHHFKGYLLDQIPLLRKLGFRTVVSGNLLLSDERKTWWEANIGWENVGIRGFRLLRIDLVNSFVGGEYRETGFVIGMNFFGMFSNGSRTASISF